MSHTADGMSNIVSANCNTTQQKSRWIIFVGSVAASFCNMADGMGSTAWGNCYITQQMGRWIILVGSVAVGGCRVGIGGLCWVLIFVLYYAARHLLYNQIVLFFKPKIWLSLKCP